METLTIEKKKTTTDKSLYEQDFYQWALHNAELLKQGRFKELDIENLVEEIESMGRNNKKELESRLAVLIMHLLKLQYQSHMRSNSWLRTINTQRVDILLVLENSPSLKHGIEGVIEKTFKKAKVQFEKETGISRKKLPDTCPYTFEHLIDDEFWPNDNA